MQVYVSIAFALIHLKKVMSPSPQYRFFSQTQRDTVNAAIFPFKWQPLHFIHPDYFIFRHSF